MDAENPTEIFTRILMNRAPDNEDEYRADLAHWVRQEELSKKELARREEARRKVPEHVRGSFAVLDRQARADFNRRTGKTPTQEDKDSSRMLGTVLIGVILLTIAACVLGYFMVGPLLESIRLNGKVEFHG